MCSRWLLHPVVSNPHTTLMWQCWKNKLDPGRRSGATRWRKPGGPGQPGRWDRPQTGSDDASKQVSPEHGGASVWRGVDRNQRQWLCVPCAWVSHATILATKHALVTCHVPATVPSSFLTLKCVDRSPEQLRKKPAFPERIISTYQVPGTAGHRQCGPSLGL